MCCLERLVKMCESCEWCMQNMKLGISRIVSEINYNFGQKSQNFPTLLYLMSLLSELLLEFCNGGGAQRT